MLRNAMSKMGRVLRRRNVSTKSIRAASRSAYEKAVRLATSSGLAAFVAPNAEVADKLSCESRTDRWRHSSHKIISINTDPIQRHYRLHLDRSLGAGNYGSVCIGTETCSGKTVAIKCVPKSRTCSSAVMDEASILQSISHEHIVEIKGVYQDKKTWYIVMERASGEELFNRIVEKGMLPEKQTVEILRQLIGAVAFLHENGIVHGDIKPENCILNEEEESVHIKLADFGSAFRLKDGRSTRKDYTAAYSPPEVILGKPSSSTAGDIWSLGVMLYILLTGIHPFDPYGDLSEDEVAERILSCSPDFSCIQNRVARNLVQKCLSKNPENRPTARELLENPWIRSAC